MSKYIKVADRKAQENREWLRAKLRKRAEEGSDDALTKLAEIEIVEQRSASKVGPLQEQIDQQTKKLRDVRAELATANEQLTSAQGRIAEIEKQNGDLVIEREGLKNDIGQLGNRIVSLNDETRRALATETQTRKLLGALKASADKLRSSAATLAKYVNLSDGFIQELFFKFFDQLAPEVFSDLGWSATKVEFWSRWYSRAKNSPTDKLIDLLHRQDCPCTGHGQQPTTVKDQDGQSRLMSDDDRQFFAALLKSRGVEVELEVGKLVATHGQEWRTRNRADLVLTPPISHRQITPVAGPRIVTWGED